MRVSGDGVEVVADRATLGPGQDRLLLEGHVELRRCRAVVTTDRAALHLDGGIEMGPVAAAEPGPESGVRHDPRHDENACRAVLICDGRVLPQALWDEDFE